MSGGHWNYWSSELDGHAHLTHNTFALLAVLEHELDWGVCGDTCPECARRRVVFALEAFFDRRGTDNIAALAIARDHKNPALKCARHGGAQ